MQAHYPPKTTAWLSTGIIFVLVAIAMADRIAISMLITPIKADFGIGDFYGGLLVGVAFSAFYIVALMPIGWAADRYSRKWILFFSLATWTLASIACGFAPGFIALFIFRMFVGAGEAGIGPGGHGIIGASFPKDELAKPFALYGIGFQVGASIGVAVAGYILKIAADGAFENWPIIGSMAPWRLAFIMIGLPGIIALFLVPLLHDPEDARRRELASAIDAAPAQKTPILPFLRENRTLFIIVLSAIGFSAVGFGCVAGWGPEYMQRQFEMSPPAAGASFGFLLLISAVISQIVYSIIADALAKRGMADSALNVGLVPLALSIPISILAMNATDQNMFLTYLFLLMCCFMPLNAMSATIIQQLAPPQLRSQLSSIYILTVTVIGMSGGPAVVGWLSEYVFGEDRLGAAISVVLVVGLVLSLAIFLAGRGRIRDAIKTASGELVPAT